MNFVDRIEETARLRDALSREKSSLVVVYGRRRLGKSTLIKRVLLDSDVYFLADRSEGQHQRTLLAKVVAQVFPDFDKLTYPDWESLFRAVNYRTPKRLIRDALHRRLTPLIYPKAPIPQSRRFRPRSPHKRS